MTMHTRWLAVGVGLAFLGAGLQPAEAAKKINKAPKGYTALFNGKDLTNWKGLIEFPQRKKLTPSQMAEAQVKADALMREHWSVKDGILIYDGKGQSLQTIKDYGDFEFFVDWKILPKGDSGIYLRGQPQVQIWETNSSAVANVDGKYVGSGGLFNNQKNPSKPLLVADKPVGEWNTFYIKMVGDRVWVKLNDKLVVDNTPLENYWERGKPLPVTGPIELQHHGNRLEFRNIFIREIPDPTLVAANTVKLELIEVPLVHALRRASRQGGVSIVLDDPNGQLAAQRIAYLKIQGESAGDAVASIARAAGAYSYQDSLGVYHVTQRRVD